MLQVNVTIDPHDVQMEHRDNRWLAKLDLAMRRESTTDKLVKFETLAIDLTEERFQQALLHGMFIDEFTVANSEGGQLLVIVQDTATGAAGSLWIPLKETP
jgi:hypothetical protein